MFQILVYAFIYFCHFVIVVVVVVDFVVCVVYSVIPAVLKQCRGCLSGQSGSDTYSPWSWPYHSFSSKGKNHTLGIPS